MYIYQASSASSANSAATSGWVQLRRSWSNVGFEVNLSATGSPIGTFVFEVTNDDNPNVPQGVILGAVPLTLTPPQSTTFQPTDGLARNVTFMFNPAPSAKWIRMRYAAGSGGTSAGLNVGITQGSAGTSLAPFIPYNSNLTLTPPLAPSLWFDAQNVDGLGNSSLTDGQAVGTWVNLGSIGATGNALQATAGAKPAFRKIATAGKLNGLSGIESIDNVRVMNSSAFSSQAQPYVVAAVWRNNNGAGVATVMGNTVANMKWYSNGGSGMKIEVSAVSVTSTTLITTGTYYMGTATVNGASSEERIDGSSNLGTTGATAFGTVISLFDSGAGQNITGIIAEILVYFGAGLPALPSIEAYFTAKYGSFPQ